MSYTVAARGGRRLAVESWGDPHGAPVFLMHGTPGSRLGPRPRVPLLYRLGIRLIAYDRPGYGGSDRHRGRQVADAAADVESIADFLGLGRFAVIGRSGGGPHALACAALLPERVSRGAALVSLAPRDADGLDWYAGMTPSNVLEYSTAEEGHDSLAARIEPQAEAIRADPASMLPLLDPQLPEADRRVVADFGIRTMLASNFAEALRTSGVGWIDDGLAFTSPWGFDVGRVHRPILLWHGEKDVFSPVSHTRWLADRIASATTIVKRGAAHFGAVAVLPEVLRWVTADGSPGRSAA